MLSLYKLSSNQSILNELPFLYVDELLTAFRFYQPTRESILRYRLQRRSGGVVNFEICRGLLVGMELLGFAFGNWDTTQERFSEEIRQEKEVPVIGMEFDDARTNASIGVTTIDQMSEFGVRYAEFSRTLEISFGDISMGSNFGPGIILYDSNLRITGARIFLSSFLKDGESMVSRATNGVGLT